MTQHQDPIAISGRGPATDDLCAGLAAAVVAHAQVGAPAQMTWSAHYRHDGGIAGYTLASGTGNTYAVHGTVVEDEGRWRATVVRSGTSFHVGVFASGRVACVSVNSALTGCGELTAPAGTWDAWNAIAQSARVPEQLARIGAARRAATATAMTRYQHLVEDGAPVENDAFGRLCLAFHDELLAGRSLEAIQSQPAEIAVLSRIRRLDAVRTYGWSPVTPFEACCVAADSLHQAVVQLGLAGVEFRNAELSAVHSFRVLCWKMTSTLEAGLVMARLMLDEGYTAADAHTAAQAGA